MRILIQVINAIGIKGGGTALNSVDDITLFQQKLSKVGAILAGDAGDEGCFSLIHIHTYAL
jgi:hypothetical protein